MPSKLKTVLTTCGLSLAAMLTLAACGETQGEETALTVNGEEVTFDELIEDVGDSAQGEGRGTVDVATLAAQAEQRVRDAAPDDPSGAEVTVSSQLGTWDAENCTVVTPADVRSNQGETPSINNCAGSSGELIDPSQPAQPPLELASIVPFEGVAATVDGVELLGEDIFGEVEQQALASEIGGAPPTLRTPDGYVSEVVAEVTTNEVVAELARAESERRGLQVTDADREEVAAGLGEVPAELSQDFVDGIIERQALFQVLVTDLAGTDRPSQSLTIDDVVCARHILVTTQEEAEAAIARIQGGEDFAVVAADVSNDGSAQAGGDLGCADPSRYVPEFADALVALAVDEQSGPVESQFGFHVIQRLETDPIQAEQALEATRLELAAAEEQGAFQEWVQVAVSESAIDIDPRIGVWDPLGGVVPADG